MSSHDLRGPVAVLCTCALHVPTYDPSGQQWVRLRLPEFLNSAGQEKSIPPSHFPVIGLLYYARYTHGGGREGGKGGRGEKRERWRCWVDELMNGWWVDAQVGEWKVDGWMDG